MRNTQCTGFRSYETLDFELPPGLTLVELPRTCRCASGWWTTRPATSCRDSASSCSARCTTRWPPAVHRAGGNEFDKQAMPIAKKLQHKVLFRRACMTDINLTRQWPGARLRERFDGREWGG